MPVHRGGSGEIWSTLFLSLGLGFRAVGSQGALSYSTPWMAIVVPSACRLSGNRPLRPGQRVNETRTAVLDARGGPGTDDKRSWRSPCLEKGFQNVIVLFPAERMLPRLVPGNCPCLDNPSGHADERPGNADFGSCIWSVPDRST